MKDIRHLGLDMDSEKIAVAVAEPGGEVRSLGTIPYRQDTVRRLVKKLGPVKQLRACYEAGPHGYSLYWQLSKLGVRCDVVAPTLVVSVKWWKSADASSERVTTLLPDLPSACPSIHPVL